MRLYYNREAEFAFFVTAHKSFGGVRNEQEEI